MTSKVPADIWCHGHVVAYMSPVDDDVGYAFMDALCEKMHHFEPAVKFDNREWLCRAHFLLYLGDHSLAVAAFRKATEGDGRTTWNVCGPGMICQPQYMSESWQKAREEEEEKNKENSEYK